MLRSPLYLCLHIISSKTWLGFPDPKFQFLTSTQNFSFRLAFPPDILTQLGISKLWFPLHKHVLPPVFLCCQDDTVPAELFKSPKLGLFRYSFLLVALKNHSANSKASLPKANRSKNFTSPPSPLAQPSSAPSMPFFHSIAFPAICSPIAAYMTL